MSISQDVYQTCLCNLKRRVRSEKKLLPIQRTHVVAHNKTSLRRSTAPFLSSVRTRHVLDVNAYRQMLIDIR